MSNTAPATALILDGDMLAYAACAGAQQEVEDPVFWWSINCDHKQARRSFQRQIDMIVSNLDMGVPMVHLCLTDEVNFRKAILPTYKAKRGLKPVGYGAFREWLQETIHPWKAWKRPGLEGDDLIGILATSETIIPQDQKRIIWSGDKDMRQIVGTHVNKLGRVVEVTPNEAFTMHVTQTLQGDVTDNYAGCPGMGPAKAKKLLDAHEGSLRADIWAAVEAAFITAGKTPEDFLVQARVARILTAEDYDFVNRTPILWSPPT